MKLAILEDRPWIVMNTIRKMKSITQIEEIDLLFYENSFEQKGEIEQSIVSECKELDVRLIRITENDFESKMNDADNRKADKRIWFYTTSGKYNITKIKNMFGKQYIPVIDYDVKQDALVFDESKLTEILSQS